MFHGIHIDMIALYLHYSGNLCPTYEAWVPGSSHLASRPSRHTVTTLHEADAMVLTPRHVCVGVGGAIESLTRGLALDLAPIRVNTVIPGMVSPCRALQLQSHLPVRRINNPEQQLAELAAIMI